MPTTAQICITSLGNLPAGSIVNAYSDTDGYTFSFNTVNVNDLLPPCPYIITNVPDNTEIIQLRDPDEPTCCVYIGLYPFYDLCGLCDLGFDNVTQNPVGVVEVGLLTGSCSENITEYIIEWYGPNGLEFTSGLGPGTYDWTHPISVPVGGGTYTPILQTITLNSITYTENINIEGCIPPIVVQNPNCINGTGGQYDHNFVFSNVSESNQTPSLSFNFDLSANTKYFAWNFKADTVSDTLKISYIGSAYVNPLVLDYIVVGSDSQVTTNNYLPNVFPKSASTTFFIKKVINLNNITYSNGDKLLIEVIPNPANENTEWTFNCTCMGNTFNCTECLSFFPTPFKIDQSSITVTPQPCNKVNISYNYCNCQTTNPDFQYINFQGSGYISGRAGTFYYSESSCFNLGNPIGNQNCAPQGTGNISFETTTPGASQKRIILKFSDINDYNAYVNSYNTMIAAIPSSSNPLEIEYYHAFTIVQTQLQGATPCGDSTTRRIFRIFKNNHTFVGSTISEPPYIRKIELTWGTLTNNYPNPGACNNCYSTVVSQKTSVDASISSPNISLETTTKSSRCISPFVTFFELIETNSTSTSAQYGGAANTVQLWSVQTIPAAGNPLTILPNLSAETCNFKTYMNTITAGALSTNPIYQKISEPDIFLRLINGTLTDFELYAGTSASPPSVLIYREVGGSVTFINNSYFC